MTPGFPNKRWFFPYGWKDLGQTEGTYSYGSYPNSVYTYSCHKFCGTIAHIGKEKSEIFKFCPKCLVKLNP